MSIHKTDKVLIFMIAVVVLLFILLFSSCRTAKELIDKAERKDPAAVAEYTRDKYPCSEILLPDTAVIYRDTTVYIDCPDSGIVVNEYITGTDTVRVQGKTVRVPVRIQVPGTVVTRWYEDSAKLRVNQVQIQRFQAENTKLASDLKDMTGKRNWFRKWFFIECGILFLLLLYAIWRIYKSATTIKMKSV